MSWANIITPLLRRCSIAHAGYLPWTNSESIKKWVQFVKHSRLKSSYCFFSYESSAFPFIIANAPGRTQQYFSICQSSFRHSSDWTPLVGGKVRCIRFCQFPPQPAPPRPLLSSTNNPQAIDSESLGDTRQLRTAKTNLRANCLQDSLAFRPAAAFSVCSAFFCAVSASTVAAAATTTGAIPLPLYGFVRQSLCIRFSTVTAATATSTTKTSREYLNWASSNVIGHEDGGESSSKVAHRKRRFSPRVELPVIATMA